MAIADVKEYTHLSPEEVEELGRELDAIRADIEESRGDDDAAYINRMITIQRRLAAAGRVTLFASRWKPAFFAGAAMLGAAKILENMEIGHNVMHGQYDWMNDPMIDGARFEWDNIAPAQDLGATLDPDDTADVVGVGLTEIVEHPLAHGVQLTAELLELLVRHVLQADRRAPVGRRADQ